MPAPKRTPNKRPQTEKLSVKGWPVVTRVVKVNGRDIRLEQGHWNATSSIEFSRRHPGTNLFDQNILEEIQDGLRQHPVAETAFQNLTSGKRKCLPETLILFLCNLRLESDYYAAFQKEPSNRPSRDAVRSLVARTFRLAEDWDRLFKIPLGLEVLDRLCKLGAPAARTEFLNVPQHLGRLADCVQGIRQAAPQRQRPGYDNALAFLVTYVELTTGEPNLKDTAALVKFATGKHGYGETNLSNWKSTHNRPLKAALKSLTLRPSQS